MGPAGIETPTPTPPVAPEAEQRTYESSVSGKQAPSRGASDYHVDIEKLSLVPHANAADYLKLAPGILLTNEGGEGHAEQVFLRGFDAREGQDIEFSVDGVPINESGNLHGNGYADTHFIIPELVESLRVIEGPFDPRQGNFAVAGSAEYHLGLQQRGLTAKFTTGSFGTYRMLLTYGPKDGATGTFAAAELYQTAGFGQNRAGRRGSVIGQYEGHIGTNTTFRLTAQAYVSSFETAGLVRQDDYKAGRIGFYGTYDHRNRAARRRRATLLRDRGLRDARGPHGLQQPGLRHRSPAAHPRGLQRLPPRHAGAARRSLHGQRGDLIDIAQPSVHRRRQGARAASTSTSSISRRTSRLATSRAATT